MLQVADNSQCLMWRGLHGMRTGESALDHFYASRALRRLVLAGREEGPGGEAARAFTTCFWRDALKGRCKLLLCKHSAKVRSQMRPGTWQAHPC